MQSSLDFASSSELKAKEWLLQDYPIKAKNIQEGVEITPPRLVLTTWFREQSKPNQAATLGLNISYGKQLEYLDVSYLAILVIWTRIYYEIDLVSTIAPIKASI